MCDSKEEPQQQVGVRPTVLVDIVEDPTSDDGLAAHWRFEGQPSMGNTPIELESPGPYTIKFSIQAPGLRFRETAEDSMWVRGGTWFCPRKPGNGGQITFRPPTDRELTVINRGTPASMRYMLRFYPDGRRLDPIIKNIARAGPGSSLRAVGLVVLALGGAYALSRKLAR